MTRFHDDGDGEGVPWGLWEQVVSRALGGRRGQAALVELEAALLALPEPRLIQGHLAAEGEVCAVGAFVAHKRAQERGEELEDVIGVMSADVPCCCGHSSGEHDGQGCHTKLWSGGECSCEGYETDEEGEDAWETARAGQDAGLAYTVAWHLAYLNDEQFYAATPEDRYRHMLKWVRRALGRA